MDNFLGSLPIKGEIVLTREPGESIVMCTPFRKKAHFYYNQKINCMRASGTVSVRGRSYAFEPADSFAVLDWGRGVWTYSNTWYWGSASGEAEGVPFGFNLGYGFGTPRPPARTPSSTTGSSTSSPASPSTSRAGPASSTTSPPGPSPATTAASRWTSSPSWTAAPT